MVTLGVKIPTKLKQLSVKPWALTHHCNPEHTVSDMRSQMVSATSYRVRDTLRHMDMFFGVIVKAQAMELLVKPKAHPSVKRRALVLRCGIGQTSSDIRRRTIFARSCCTGDAHRHFYRIFGVMVTAQLMKLRVKPKTYSR